MLQGYIENSQTVLTDHLSFMKFIGTMLGKAVYEVLVAFFPIVVRFDLYDHFMFQCILVDVKFSGAFLNSLLRKISSLDDLAYLDSQLLKNLVSMKNFALTNDIADLGLFFEVNILHGRVYVWLIWIDTVQVNRRHSYPTGDGMMMDDDGYGQAPMTTLTTELIPGGSGIAVTNDNVASYVHRLAHYKLHVETYSATQAFLSGFHEMLSKEWLALFSPQELDLVICGELKAIDVEEMQNHVQYGGGYHPSQPYVQV